MGSLYGIPLIAQFSHSAKHRKSVSRHYYLRHFCAKVFTDFAQKYSPNFSKKRELVDPSLVIAALGVGPNYFYTDLKTFGFLFETLCIRDLKIYSSLLGGRVSYYHDRYGLEADCVLHLRNGRYALIEFKLGSSEIDNGAKHLLEIESLIAEHNSAEKQCPLRLPDLKVVITGTQYGYKRKDGVYVIPIGCLKD